MSLKPLFWKENTMVKKTAIGGGIALLLMLLCFGRSTYSYLTTTLSRVHDSVKSAVPIDFELDRARKEASRIIPEVRRNMHVIASEEVKIEQLEKRIKVMEEKLVQDQKDIMHLKADLESGISNFIYSGVTFTAKEVKRDLEDRFEEFTLDEETLKNLVKLLKSRDGSLRVARERLAEMQAVQRKLVVEIDNLEARNKMVTVAKASSEVSFDDSQLSRTRELLNAIESRIRADEKLLNAESRTMGRIPLEHEEEEADILQRVSSYFPVEQAQADQLVEVVH
jgi:hypothetical protein